MLYIYIYICHYINISINVTIHNCSVNSSKCQQNISSHSPGKERNSPRGILTTVSGHWNSTGLQLLTASRDQRLSEIVRDSVKYTCRIFWNMIMYMNIYISIFQNSNEDDSLYMNISDRKLRMFFPIQQSPVVL